jgi:hypothetical protein
VTWETSSIKSNNFCGRLRSWAAFISLGHWSLAVHLFAVLSNRKRVYNSLVGLDEKLSYKGISSWSNFARYKSIIIQGVGEWSSVNQYFTLNKLINLQNTRFISPRAALALSCIPSLVSVLFDTPDINKMENSKCH